MILVGGFAASRSLKAWLGKELQDTSTEYGYPIRLIECNRNYSPYVSGAHNFDDCLTLGSGTAVASGAVLRALNKENGPKRHVLSSYGLLRTEPYEPEVWDRYPEVRDAHRSSRPTYNPHEGLRYIKDTLHWVVKKVRELPALKEIDKTVALTNK